MTDKELKKLKRDELLEMLISQIEENERLKARLEEKERRLQERRIAVEQAGSIADAALRLNSVFEAAQSAAQQYLENIQFLSSEQDSICRRTESEAKKKAAAIIARADAYQEKSRAEAEAYQKSSRAEADAYWNRVRERVQGLLHEQENPQGPSAPHERGGRT